MGQLVELDEGGGVGIWVSEVIRAGAWEPGGTREGTSVTGRPKAVQVPTSLDEKVEN